MDRPLFPDVRVNGEPVPHSLIAAEAQNHVAPKGKPGFAWRRAANAMAIRTLLLQEARRRGIDPEPRPLGSGRRESEEEALIRGLLDREVRVAPPTEAEVRAEWARDPGRFRAPPLWEASHILCACDHADGAARAATLARARHIAHAVSDAPGSFAAVAARESDCGSKSAGGMLGQLGPGDTVPEFEAALRLLAEGAVTEEPVASPHGWHVIRLDAAAEGAVLPFEAVRPRVAAAIEKAAWARVARAFVARLAAAAEITGADLTDPEAAAQGASGTGSPAATAESDTEAPDAR
jgi:peptidyl-prolyl cis-trans isomerase C